MSSPPATPFEPFEPSLALSGLSLLALRFRSGLFLALAPCGDGDGENKNKDYPASLTHLGPLFLLKKAHAHRPALPSQSIPKYVCTDKVRTQSTNLIPIARLAVGLQGLSSTIDNPKKKFMGPQRGTKEENEEGEEEWEEEGEEEGGREGEAGEEQAEENEYGWILRARRRFSENTELIKQRALASLESH